MVKPIVTVWILQVKKCPVPGAAGRIEVAGGTG